MVMGISLIIKGWINGSRRKINYERDKGLEASEAFINNTMPTAVADDGVKVTEVEQED